MAAPSDMEKEQVFVSFFSLCTTIFVSTLKGVYFWSIKSWVLLIFGWEQIFAMAEKEMEYRVEMFNKYVPLSFFECFEVYPFA